MKYKLINTKTKEETICEKVTIDGFDYYVSDEIIKDVRPYKGKWQIEEGTILNKFPTYLTDLSSCRLVIATTNPNIDIPKVVDEVEIKVDEILNKELPNFTPYHRRSFFLGYNKSQETHPFSEEDMIEFVNWVAINYVPTTASKELKYWQKDTYQNKEYFYSTKELLQLWKEQRTKTLYYE